MTAIGYLDNNGSTPLDPAVLDVMLPIMRDGVGNASAANRWGQVQAHHVEHARGQVADCLGVDATAVIFTAGATEANNLALVATMSRSDRARLLVSAVEHASVRNTAKALEETTKATVAEIPVTPGGYVDLDALDSMLNADVALISIMAANSETGVLNPIADVVELAHRHGALVHTDATQIVGRLPFDARALDVDMVSVSSHKIYGPTGVGALTVPRQLQRKSKPIIHGGGHENGLRSGSLNVAGIAGFGAAAELAKQNQPRDAAHMATLRDRVVSELDSVPGMIEHGDVDRRLPNTANIAFAEVDAEALLLGVDPVAISSGSACSSRSIEPSHVLLAMGIDRNIAIESVRYSVGRFTTDADIDLAIRNTIDTVTRIRTLNTETINA